MTRWMRPPELEPWRQRDRFDPAVAGDRRGLSQDVSLAIWERVSANATDGDGQCDMAQAEHRFHEIAARVAERGGRLLPDVGRLTRVETEITGVPDPAWGAIDLAPRIPGKDTLVAFEARRRAVRNNVALRPENVGGARATSEPPGSSPRPAEKQPADRTLLLPATRAALLGGTEAGCKEAPTAEWRKMLDQFYTGKLATILDGFDVDMAELTPVHHAQLDGIAAKLRADNALKAQLGGACDLIEEQSAMLSLQRAERARDYLAGKGVAQGRLEIQSYGFDWARVEPRRMMAEGKNRRVQIWLNK